MPVDYYSAALQKITSGKILNKLLQIPYSKDTFRDIMNQEDLIGQSKPPMEKVVSTIILSLIRKDASKFKKFLQALKDNKQEDLAQELRK